MENDVLKPAQSFRKGLKVYFFFFKSKFGLQIIFLPLLSFQLDTITFSSPLEIAFLMTAYLQVTNSSLAVLQEKMKQ